MVMAFNLPDNRRREVTVVAGIIGTLLGAFGILDHIESFLSFLAFLVCPVGGAMMADYWLVGKGNPKKLAFCRRYKLGRYYKLGHRCRSRIFGRIRIYRYPLFTGRILHC